jgi:hypothetical protein
MSGTTVTDGMARERTRTRTLATIAATCVVIGAPAIAAAEPIAPGAVSVPEPSTLALTGAALTVLGVLVRRRRADGRCAPDAAASLARTLRGAVGRPAAAFALAAAFAALLIAAATSAMAEDLATDVNFVGVNLSPWNSGPTFELKQDINLGAPFNASLPNLNGNPVQAIADLLNIPLPAEAGVSIGGTVNGNFNIDLGYDVYGGRVNIDYPALGTISIPTTTVNGVNDVVPGQALNFSSTFQPGLNQTFHAESVGNLAAVGGSGYSLKALGFDVTQVKNPVFATQFPSAAAWADVSYNVNAGVGVDANLKVAGICIVCASKSLTFGDAQNFELLNITPQDVVVAGHDYGNLGSITVPLGPAASISANIPDLAVSGGLSGDGRTLTGSGSQPVVTINASLDKLVPLVGAALSNNIGPIGYTLLSATGGPQLSLYQNFSYAPKPTVELLFNRPVLERTAGGLQAVTSVTFDPSGSVPSLEVPWNGGGQIQVQAIYNLDGTLHNETGLSVGASVTLSALGITTPLGPAGPAFTTTLNSDPLAKIPLFSQSFDESLGQIAHVPVTLDVEPFDPLARTADHLVSVIVGDATPLGTVAQLTVSEDLPTEFEDSIYDVNGTVLNVGTAAAPESIFVANRDVILDDGADIGNAFCIVCTDLALDTASPNVTGVDGSTLYTSNLSTYPDADPCDPCDAHLSGTSYFDDPTAIPTVIGPTVVVYGVPEPAWVVAPWLLALPALTWRTRRGGCARRLDACEHAQQC